MQHTIRTIWRNSSGKQVAETLALVMVVLALLGAAALVFSGNGSIGEAASATITRFISGSAGQPNASVQQPVLPAPGSITPETIGGATLGVSAMVAANGSEASGGLSYWLAAVVGFVGTLVVGLVAAVVVGGLLFALSLISAKLALIVGAILLVAALGYLIYTRWGEFSAQNKPWYAYPLLLPLALGDLLGLTGIIEGITGRDLVSGAPLSASEAGNRLGSGFAGLLLSLVTFGEARSGHVAGRGLARWMGLLNPGKWLERVRIKLPNGTVLGWGGFDISVSKLWSIKRSFTAWDKQVMQDIARRITQIADFNPATWASKLPLDQRRAARRLVDIVMEAHGIPKSRFPKFEFKPLNPDEYGYAYWDPALPRGELVVNSANSIGDIVGTIVHEGRHYFQMWQAYQVTLLGRDIAKLHPQTAKWIANIPSFGGVYHTSGKPYFTQPIEVDAESFGRRIIDLLPVRWPSFGPTAPAAPPAPAAPSGP